MSYILDALQRADAERERGHVPGLHSQIVPPAHRKAVPARRWKPARTAVAVAMVALIAAALWWWYAKVSAPIAASASSSSSASPVAAAPATDVAPVTPPAPVAPPAPAPTPSAAVPAPAATPVPPPVRPILAPPREEPPSKPRAPTAAAAKAAAPAAEPPAPAATATPTPSSKPANADTNTASKPPLRSFAELTPEARAQLPQVNVSGATYSQNPSLRMLIVNGKVLHEGQEIAPGFKLESIGQRSAVLNHQGLRYSIGY